MWFFPIVPIRGRLAGNLIGIVSSREVEKVHISYNKLKDWVNF